VLVAKDDTGQGLDFEVEHGRPLGLRETPDLGLGELDVLDGLGRHPAVAGLDFGAAQPERRGAPLVEPFGAVPSYELTTLRQPVHRMAEAAVSMLLECVEEPGRPPERRLFAASLIEGRSARLGNVPPP
jgi:hypothetical protein